MRFTQATLAASAVVTAYAKVAPIAPRVTSVVEPQIQYDITVTSFYDACSTTPSAISTGVPSITAVVQGTVVVAYCPDCKPTDTPVPKPWGNAPTPWCYGRDCPHRPWCASYGPCSDEPPCPGPWCTPHPWCREDAKFCPSVPPCNGPDCHWPEPWCRGRGCLLPKPPGPPAGPDGPGLHPDPWGHPDKDDEHHWGNKPHDDCHECDEEEEEAEPCTESSTLTPLPHTTEPCTESTHSSSTTLEPCSESITTLTPCSESATTSTPCPETTTTSAPCTESSNISTPYSEPSSPTSTPCPESSSQPLPASSPLPSCPGALDCPPSYVPPVQRVKNETVPKIEYSSAPTTTSFSAFSMAIVAITVGYVSVVI